MIDTQYIEELRSLEDKKEAKAKLIAYGEQFSIKVKKSKGFDGILEDIKVGMQELADEPMPETDGLSITDLIQAADESDGTSMFKGEASEEAMLLIDSVEATPEVIDVQINAPIGDKVITVVNQDGVLKTVESPVQPFNEEAFKEAVEHIIKAEEKVEELFELPENFNPTLIQMGKGAGYVTLPWWIYDWITKNPEWKKYPRSFPHYYGHDTLLSLIYFIKRDGQVRIRETRNSSFVVLK